MFLQLNISILARKLYAESIKLIFIILKNLPDKNFFFFFERPGAKNEKK